MSSSGAHVNVGDKVIVMPHSEAGVVKYKGPTEFKSGIWIGVHLNNPNGKNNGTVDGKHYFDCPPGYGIFVLPMNVQKVRSSAVAISPASKGKAVGPGKKLARASSQASFDTFFLDSQVALGSVHEDLFPAAIDYENFHFLKILVEEDDVPITGADMRGNNVLHHVCADPLGVVAKKAVKVLEYLVEKGALQLLHHRNLAGQTPVMCASHNHSWDAMEYLVGLGADSIYKGPVENLPSVWDDCRADIPLAVPKLHAGLAKQKKGREEGTIEVPYMKHRLSTLVQALFKTAHAGDQNYVRMLVEERHLNVNETDTEGNNVLHWISGDPKRLNLIKYFVSMGAKISHKNKVGDSPCLIAARARNWEVMKFYISSGARVSEKDQINKKSVFKYAQVNGLARKALAEGLAIKRKNRTSAEESDDEATERDEKESNYDDDTQSEMSDQSAITVDGFHSAEEVLADIKAHNEEEPTVIPASPKSTAADPDAVAATASSSSASSSAAAADASNGDDSSAGPAEPVSLSLPSLRLSQSSAGLLSPRKVITSAGTFIGAVVGRKKNKKKVKMCKVQVTDQGVVLQYKKGPILKRKDIAEEYQWSDQMSIVKEGDDTLQVTLDPDAEIVLTINQCPAETLEEFIWKNIWKSVFEGSVKETQQLFTEYYKLCKHTLESLEAANKKKDEIFAAKAKLAGGDDEKAKDELAQQEEDMYKVYADSTARFPSLRKQGETLKESYAKMYEALDRRLQAETQRLKEFTAKEMFTKAEEIKVDQSQIKEQMMALESEQKQVDDMYETMTTAELQYGHIGGVPDALLSPRGGPSELASPRGDHSHDPNAPFESY